MAPPAIAVLWTLLLLAVVDTQASDIKDSFNEELLLKNLPDGKVYAHFQFTTKWNMSLEAEDSCECICIII